LLESKVVEFDIVEAASDSTIQRALSHYRNGDAKRFCSANSSGNDCFAARAHRRGAKRAMRLG
jgi:hypothetical protein